MSSFIDKQWIKYQGYHTVTSRFWQLILCFYCSRNILSPTHNFHKDILVYIYIQKENRYILIMEKYCYYFDYNSYPRQNIFSEEMNSLLSSLSAEFLEETIQNVWMFLSGEWLDLQKKIKLEISRVFFVVLSFVLLGIKNEMLFVFF